MALTQRESLAVQLSELRVVERAFDDLFDRVGARKLRHEEALQVVADELLAENQAFCRTRASCGWGTFPNFVDPRAIVEHQAPGPPPSSEGVGTEQAALFSTAPSPWSRPSDSEPEPGKLSTVVFVARSVCLPTAVQNRQYRPRVANVERIVPMGLPDDTRQAAKSKRRTAARRGGRAKPRSRGLRNSLHETAEADEKACRTIRMRPIEAPSRDQSMDFIVKIVTAKHKRLMTPWQNNLPQSSSTSNDKTDCSKTRRSFLHRNVRLSRDRMRQKQAVVPRSVSGQDVHQSDVQPSSMRRGGLAAGNKSTEAVVLDGRANLLASASRRHRLAKGAGAATSFRESSLEITEFSTNGEVGRRRNRTHSSRSHQVDQPKKAQHPQRNSRVENAFRRLLSGLHEPHTGGASPVREVRSVGSVSLLDAISSVDVPASSRANRSSSEPNSLLSSVVVEDDEDESSNGTMNVARTNDGNLSAVERGSPVNGFHSLLDAIGGVDTDYTSSLLPPSSSQHHFQVATHTNDDGVQHNDRGRRPADVSMVKKKRNFSRGSSRQLHRWEHCPRCGFQVSGREAELEQTQRKRQRIALDRHESSSTLTRMYGGWQQASPKDRMRTSTAQSSDEADSDICEHGDGGTSGSESALFSSLLDRLFPRLCLPASNATMQTACPCSASLLWDTFQPRCAEQVTRTHKQQTESVSPPLPSNSQRNGPSVNVTCRRTTLMGPNQKPLQDSLSQTRSLVERASHPSRAVESQETTLRHSQSWLARFWADCGVGVTLQQHK